MEGDNRDAKEVSDFDWPAFFFDEKNRLAQRMLIAAKRRFGASADAESAYNFALEGISANEWQRLREGYRGTGRPDGFLAITFANLMEEYAVRKYGRKRPPKWIKDLGGMWPKVYQMLCLRRLLPETIVDILSVKAAQVADEVRRAIEQVRARIPNCGIFVGETYVDGDVEVEIEKADSKDAPQGEIAADELRLLCDVLRSVFPPSDAEDASHLPAVAASAVSTSQLTQLRDNLVLEDLDRLVLKLIYMEGQSIAKAARSLGLREHNVRRRHKRLLSTLHDQLRAHGVDAAAFG